MSGPGHKETVRRSFAARAATYREGRQPGENIAPMIDLSKPQPSDRMLDVACGAGLVTLAFAPVVARAVGVDLTPEMLEIARRGAAERGIGNVQFEVGDAETLQFPAGSFELVACRSAFHHLERAEKAMHEMARVLAPGGRIVIYDLVCSDDPGKAAQHNEIMRLRDPSHVRMLSPGDWLEFFRRCALHVAAKTVVMMKREFDDWMDAAAADADRRARVRQALLASGNAAGLVVRERQGRITFTQTAGIWLLTK